MELNLPRLLEVLERHKVEYVLIGGLAAVYHGSPFPTGDADITPRTDRTNLARLAAALKDLDARVRTESEPDGLPFRFGGYRDLRRDAEPAQLYGVTVRIASLADVIRSKQAANRPKDQRVLPTLREILARRSNPM